MQRKLGLEGENKTERKAEAGLERRGKLEMEGDQEKRGTIKKKKRRAEIDPGRSAARLAI